MALYFKSDNPQKLLDEFKKAIEEGKIATWSCDEDGDFTHTPEQWQKKAWLHPKIESGQLAFYIIPPKGTNITTLVYAVYHGRFIESMLHHCDKLFSDSIATALPMGSDNVSQR